MSIFKYNFKTKGEYRTSAYLVNFGMSALAVTALGVPIGLGAGYLFDATTGLPPGATPITCFYTAATALSLGMAFIQQKIFSLGWFTRAATALAVASVPMILLPSAMPWIAAGTFVFSGWAQSRAMLRRNKNNIARLPG